MRVGAVPATHDFALLSHIGPSLFRPKILSRIIENRRLHVTAEISAKRITGSPATSFVRYKTGPSSGVLPQIFASLRSILRKIIRNNMSNLHLGHGSKEPPRESGKVRLYSMYFCPFAHRVRLALTLKKIPHDIVNINVSQKPDWYMNIHPEGKVPALVDLAGNVVVDSTVILNFLDEKYPEPPFYNKDTADEDLKLIESFEKIVKVFGQVVHKKDHRPLQESVDEISQYLVEFEEDLKKKNTPFFTGKTPGMLDIHIWPFVERAKALPIISKQTFEFKKEKFPHIIKWTRTMRHQDFVKENMGSYEAFAKVVVASHAGPVDYDKF